jgi:ligand-binding sensor domain-containing protein
MWFAGEKGISRYDGNNFIHFESGKDDLIESTSEYNTLFKASDGKIWVGSHADGVIVIDPNKMKIIHHFKKSNETANGLRGNNCRILFEDKNNNIWIGVNSQGLARYNAQDSTFTSIPTFLDEQDLQDNNRFQLHFHAAIQDVDDASIFWILTLRGIIQFNTESLSSEYIYSSSKGDNEVLGGLDISTENGVDLWISSWANGVKKFNTRTKEISYFQCGDEPLSWFSCQNTHQTIQIDSNNLMVLSPTGGLFNLNKQDGQFKKLKAINGPHSPIYGMIDSRNILWISGERDGMYYSNLNFQSYNEYLHLGNIKKSIEKDNHIYSIGNNGLFYDYTIKTKELQTIKFKKLKPKEEFSYVDLDFDSKGKLWVLGFYDLFYYDFQTKEIKREMTSSWEEINPKASYHWSMAIDKNDKISISSQDGGLKVYEPYKNKSLLYNFIEGDSTSMRYNYSVGNFKLDFQNLVWGAGGGVFKFDTEKGIFHNFDEPLKTISGEHVAMNYPVFCPISHNKNFLIGPLNTSLIATLENKKNTNFIRLHSTANLPKSKVYEVVLMGDSTLWMASNTGLLAINHINDQSKYYSIKHGFEELKNIFIDQNDNLIISSAKGLLKTIPEKLINHNIGVKPYIIGMKIFDSDYPNELIPFYLNKVSLSYKQNFFSIKYSSLDYFSSGQKKYRYKLEGLDPDWVEADTRTYAGYTNVGGGSYLFRLQVKNEDGSWSDNEANLNIEITYPFWQTPFFWIMVLGGLIAILYFLYKYRINQIKKEEQLVTAFNKRIAEVEMKALRSQMNPHFIFNSLNAIKYYVLHKESEKAADYLTNFSKLIRLILNNSAQKFISLETEINTLSLYIDIENLRFENRFETELKVDPAIDIDGFMIPPLMFQPYVENAIWHGLMHKKDGKGKLSVIFSKIEKGIKCEIADNGIGREMAALVKSKSAQKEKSMGMSLTKSRMDMSQVSFELKFNEKIIDQYNEFGKPAGTLVVIEIVKQ